MRRLLDGLYRVSLLAAAVFLVAICAVVIMQVLLNLIDRISGLLFGSAIGLTVPSYADFTGFFLAAATFLALAGTLRDGGHIRVTLLTGILSRRVQRYFELWCVLLAMGVTMYACWYMFSLIHESYKYNDLSPGIIAVPIWIPQSAMAFGLSVLAIALVDEFFSLLTGHDASWHDKGEKLLDGSGE
ncbi:MAG TPA: TRAP transporter small permease [Rhizobiales bacterium]|nr:TRAP transporter small permease [Hyphomicrobiales bacterium]